MAPLPPLMPPHGPAGLLLALASPPLAPPRCLPTPRRLANSHPPTSEQPAPPPLCLIRPLQTLPTRRSLASVCKRWERLCRLHQHGLSIRPHDVPSPSPRDLAGLLAGVGRRGSQLSSLFAQDFYQPEWEVVQHLVSRLGPQLETLYLVAADGAGIHLRFPEARPLSLLLGRLANA